MNLLDDTRSSNGVNLPGFNNMETTVAVVLVVREPTQCRPNPGVDVGIVPQ